MSSDDAKFLAFGRMVWGMMTDCLVAGGTAYARKTITFPVNPAKTEKGSMELIVTTDPKVADIFEKAVAGEFAVADMKPAEGVQ